MNVKQIAKMITDAGYIATIESNTRVRVSLSRRKIYAMHVGAEFPTIRVYQDGATVIATTQPYMAR